MPITKTNINIMPIVIYGWILTNSLKTSITSYIISIIISVVDGGFGKLPDSIFLKIYKYIYIYILLKFI